MDKGGQHVGPSVGTFARLKQENRDLKARVEMLEKEISRRHRVDTDTIEGLKKDVTILVKDVVKLSVERDNLRELQVSAEDITGPADWFDDNIKPEVRALHKAIRKVKGME